MKIKEQIKQLKGVKKVVLMISAAILSLCVLAAGGFAVWWIATAPSGAVDFDNLTQRDIYDLYRQRSDRSRTSTPPRLSVLVGSLGDDENLIFISNEHAPAVLPSHLQELVPEDGQSTFYDNERLLTDRETFEQLVLLNEMPETQRSMFIRALTMLALTRDLSEVRYTVHYAQPPENTTLAQYVAQQGGAANVRSQGGAAFIFSAELASRVIGRDIGTVAETRESFYSFMREIETIDFEALPPGHQPVILPTMLW